MLKFIYNESGVCAIQSYTGNATIGPVFAVERDSFGNVVRIWNVTSLQVRYEYDAWGNHRIFNGSGLQIFDSREGIVACGYESNIGVLNP
ncbi:MAG: RHS repeat protein [Firmicutes bacterium]|nr:RHS repeat protein [Bacillota bacterium]